MVFVYVGAGLLIGFSAGFAMGINNKRALLLEKKQMEKAYNRLLDKMKTDGK